VTDPVYGDNPLDPAELWNGSFSPALVADPEWAGWRAVVVQLLADFLESQWLTRWRRALVTAEGEQLRVWGDQLSYIQPDGWADSRWRDVLIALLPASLLPPTPEVVGNLATALLDVGQSWTHVEEFPLSDRFTFLETDADDADAYLSALDRARPEGAQYYLVAHPGGGGDPFIIDSSLIDGPDTIGLMLWSLSL